MQILDLLIFCADICSHTSLLSSSQGTHGGLVYRHLTKTRQISLFFPCYHGDIILLGRWHAHMQSWDANPLVKLRNSKCKHIQEQDVTKALKSENKPSDNVCSGCCCLIICYLSNFRKAPSVGYVLI